MDQENQKSSHARNIAYIRISGTFLYDMFKTSEPRVIAVRNGLPKDAKFLRMEKDPMTGALVAMFEHPSFPEVDDGRIVQKEISPMFHEYWGERAIEELSGNNKTEH